MSLSRKPKYRNDLVGQQAETEINYARLMRLLPDLDDVDGRDFEVELAGDRSASFRLRVTERCRYTTMLELSQQLPDSAFTPSPSFALRAYHDVRMAEVVAFQRHRNLKPQYDYPNDQMYHSDEKAQLNRLLGEWLSHCLQHGRAVEAVAD